MNANRQHLLYSLLPPEYISIAKLTSDLALIADNNLNIPTIEPTDFVTHTIRGNSYKINLVLVCCKH
jgi:hypothetical protein